MDLREYLRILRLHWKVILACTLIGVASAAVFLFEQTPMYESSSQLVVKATNSTLSDAYTANTLAQQRVQTYVQLVSSPLLVRKAAGQLGLSSEAGAIAGRVTADAPLNTALLNIHVSDPSAVRAQRIAQALDAQVIHFVDDLEGGTATQQAPIHLIVTRPPQIPGGPSSPRKSLDLGLGLLIGLMVGFSAAVVRVTLDVRVSSSAELVEQFNTTLLSVVAYDPDARDRPLISQADARSPRAEAFRRLRTNLQFAGLDERPRSLVITSTMPNEGKTTTACNLAIVLAESGLDVVLVEGDLRRPRVADYMGIEGAVGLTDVLVGNLSLDEAMQPWGTTSRLSVLASGPLPPNPSEVLGSKHMHALIGELEEKGLVVIDAPPLLPVTDAAVLTNRSSGAIMVVKAKSVRRDQLRTALDSIRAVEGHLYGAVYNMAPARGPDAYGYGYGYGYGGFGEGDPWERRRLREAVPVEADQPAPEQPVALPPTSSKATARLRSPRLSSADQR